MDYRVKHGLYKTSIYNSWQCMKSRCNNPSTNGFERYGGKGIIYDPKWETFKGFWKDMGDSWKTGHTLDRLDSDKNYYKENCRWATPKEQSWHIKTIHPITWKGQTKSIGQWAHELGIKYPTLAGRINRGKWSLEKVFNTPIIPRNYSKQK